MFIIIRWSAVGGHLFGFIAKLVGNCNVSNVDSNAIQIFLRYNIRVEDIVLPMTRASLNHNRISPVY
jgi:hypothetical protein